MSAVFSWRGGRLDHDRYEEAVGVIRATDLPEREAVVPRGFTVRAPGELVRRWIHQALRDVDTNIVDGVYFGAGTAFGPVVFTRDFSLSGLLALNRLFPALMRSSMRYDRDVRFRTHWSVTRQCSVVDRIGWPLVPTDLDKEAFLRDYRTSDITRRSDDVVWIWSYHDLLTQPSSAFDSSAEWLWFYETAVRCFEAYYGCFRDPADGLYRGQSCIVDVMMCGYAAQQWREDSRDSDHFRIRHVDDADNDTRWRPGVFPASLRRCLMLKAASTNALYVQACRALADAAGRLGRTAEARDWTEQAETLRQQLRASLLLGQERPAYLLGDDGEVDSRQHTLATSFWVLAGILSPAEGRRALALYPTLDWGVPFYDPFYADNPHLYHNHACWPFADAFHHLAWQHAAPSEENSLRWACRLGRSCRDGEGFREITEAATGMVAGSAHQLWSAAGFLGACLELGWLAPD